MSCSEERRGSVRQTGFFGTGGQERKTRREVACNDKGQEDTNSTMIFAQAGKAVLLLNRFLDSKKSFLVIWVD